VKFFLPALISSILSFLTLNFCLLHFQLWLYRKTINYVLHHSNSIYCNLFHAYQFVHLMKQNAITTQNFRSIFWRQKIAQEVRRKYHLFLKTLQVLELTYLVSIIYFLAWIQANKYLPISSRLLMNIITFIAIDIYLLELLGSEVRSFRSFKI